MFVFTDVPALAVAGLADKLNFPIVAGSTIPVAGPKDSLYVRFLNRYSDYAQAIGKYLGKQGYKSVELMMVDDPYYLGYAKALDEVLRAQGVKVFKTNFGTSAADFRTDLMKMNQRKPSIVGLLIFPPQIKTVFRQMRELKMNFEVFGADDFESNSLLEDAAGLMEGAPYALHEVSAEFTADYRKEFKNDLYLSYAASTYEFARACARLVSSMSSPKNPKSLLEAFKRVANFQGVLGNTHLRWSKEGGSYFYFPVVIKKVRGAEREVVERG